ncbi:zona pellucida-like domain-containing protein 1 isoform X2 [Betta splendens]|nr:zona pellucida-like domain-containing protein 1 isoform X2 [Betta splendens]
MLLACLTYQLSTLLLARGQNACIKHSTFREPANSDIEVFCGSQTVELEILLCPIIYLEYNESMLALNSQFSMDKCKGTPDWVVDPPVIRFRFFITEKAIAFCSSKLTVIEEVGTGVFSDISSVQFINISGTVRSQDLNTAIVNYQQDLAYKFSCRYPLQYLMDNTDIQVAEVNLAVKDSTGTFVSALSMQIFSDSYYIDLLQIPPEGLEVRTRIYVEVKASNLTKRFNLLLDHCYATPLPFAYNITGHDLFVGCDRDCETLIIVNGEQQEARFSFEAFRLLQNQGPVSTYYIHCATRLCVKTICPDLVENCTTDSTLRKVRSITSKHITTVTDTATVSSGPITIRPDDGNLVASESTQTLQTETPKAFMNSILLAVSLIAGTIGTICLSLLAFVVYMSQSNVNPNTILCPPK